ncbi:MAG: hypothetical protein U0350_23855 [Caldilineaceae bacterium]
MYSHDYSFIYNPAMPTVELEIGLARGRVRVTLPAIIDSGADATMVPLRYLRQIRALPIERKQLRGILGATRPVQMYNIFVQLGEYGLFTRVAGSESNDEPIVGRDVLNQFIVTLNGLASMVEITR